MSVQSGASGTPKKNKTTVSEIPILTVNESNDDAKKQILIRKRENKFLIAQLILKRGKKCQKCMNLHKELTDPSKKGKDRSRAEAIKHLRDSHRVAGISAENTINLEETNVEQGSSQSLAWDNSDLSTAENPTEKTDNMDYDVSYPTIKQSQDMTIRKRPRTTYQIPIANRYGALTDESEVEEEPTENVQRSKRTRNDEIPNQNRQQNKQKVERPPPIILNGTIGNKEAFQRSKRRWDLHLKNGYSVKFTKNNTIINPYSIEDYKNYTKALKEEDQELEWHTYSTRENRTHAFIVKGLDHRPDPDDLKLELSQQYNVKVKDIYVIETRYRPLYMVVTTVEHKLSQLQRDIKLLNNISVTWERRRQISEVIFCKKCSRWGHAASNCYRAVRCGRCAGPHRTNTDCQNDYKCANCGGQHSANSRDCPVYEYKTNMLRRNNVQQTEQHKQSYVPAPPPSTNAWEQRARLQERQRQAGTTTRTRDRVDNSGNNNFSDLSKAMSELNNITNIPEIIRIINDLASSLRVCSNKLERFNVILDFTSRIDNYDI